MPLIFVKRRTGADGRAIALSMTKRLGIIGADGRMGRAVERLAQQWDIAARVSEASPELDALADCDVVIDFSAPDALTAALPHLRDGAALVSGTTGLGEAQEAEVRAASARLAVLRSGNFSLGIAVLMDLAERAARALGEGWDVDILEQHHRHKVDAPSGTALMLGQAVAQGRGVALGDVSAHERSGARREGDIGFAVLRGGGVYGVHEVRLVSGSEEISLGHRALNRDVFASGALDAARWLMGKPAGTYQLSDLLGGG